MDEKEFDYNELQQRVDLLESGGQNDDKYRHEQFAWPAEREEFLNRISLLESRLVEQNRQFDAERQQWIEDKSRVVRFFYLFSFQVYIVLEFYRLCNCMKNSYKFIFFVYVRLCWSN